jgi:Na+/melibiose symporter-like transporter
MSIDKELLDRLMEGRSADDLFGKDGILSALTKALAERALSKEMDVHLDEERIGEAPEGQNQPANRRNGSSQKTVTTDSGKVVLVFKELFETLSNGSFIALFVAALFGAVASGLVSVLSLCFFTYFSGFTDAQTGAIFLGTFIAAVMGFVLAPIVSRKLG